MPPAASTIALYAVPATPFGKEAVVIASPELMTSVKVFVAVRAVGVELSVTVIVTEAVPAAVGVPVICPVDAFIVSPAGKPAADHEYGGTPPVAAAVALYATLITPDGNAEVVMDNGTRTVIEKVFEAVCGVGEPESVTVTVTGLVPAAVGVPVICPVLALMLRPAGNPVADQLKAGVPPEASTVAL